MPGLDRAEFVAELQRLSTSGATQAIRDRATKALERVTAEGRARRVLAVLRDTQSTEPQVLTAIGHGLEFFMRGGN